MILFLNSIAGSEIVVILLFVLIFFGAKSIPGISRNLGRGIRQIKNASQDIQDEIRKTSSDMHREMNINRTINQTKEQFEKPMQDFKRQIDSSAEELKKNVEITPKKPATPPESISKNKIEKAIEKPNENSNTTEE